MTNLPVVIDAKLPQSYERAKIALEECESIDECKDWADKSAALASYARQAKDDTLHTLATRIAARAIRRCGELLKTFQAPGARTDQPPAGGHGRLTQRQAAEDAGLSEHQELQAVRVANVPADEFEAAIESDDPPTITALAERGTSRMTVHFSSETPEHYTPATFLDAVQRVFGDVPDLDPCSNDQVTPNVQARAHYTAADDGLAQPWFGTIFMNPPYGREIVDWVHKLRQEWRRGQVKEAIALLPARTDTEWFDLLTAETDDLVLCFLRGRLTFIGNQDPAPFPSMAAYLGLRHDAFADVFIELGSLWQRPPRGFFVNQE